MYDNNSDNINNNDDDNHNGIDSNTNTKKIIILKIPIKM